MYWYVGLGRQHALICTALLPLTVYFWAIIIDEHQLHGFKLNARRIRFGSDVFPIMPLLQCTCALITPGSAMHFPALIARNTAQSSPTAQRSLASTACHDCERSIANCRAEWDRQDDMRSLQDVVAVAHSSQHGQHSLPPGGSDACICFLGSLIQQRHEVCSKLKIQKVPSLALESYIHMTPSNLV